MTTTTLSIDHAAQHRACPRHGLLDGELKRCSHPGCDKHTYDLRDENERDTLLAVRRVTERPRRVRYAIAAGAIFVVAKAVLFGMTTDTYEFSIDASIAPAVAAGFGLAWALRSAAIHKLDKRLGLKLL